jgi:hypothetical protein
VKVSCILQGIWPQCEVDCLQPAGARVEQLPLCAFQEVSDGLLDNAILEVGIYPTEGELMSCFMACLLEGVVMEASIVAVIMEDLDSVFWSVLFECKIGS